MDDEVPNLYQQYEEVKYKLKELEETCEVSEYKRLSSLMVNIRYLIEDDLMEKRYVNSIFNEKIYDV